MEKKVLYQHGTLGALMASLMSGTAKIADICQLGDFGIGTLDGVDGEVMIVAGEVYQARADGSVHIVAPSTLTPYAAVTNFCADDEKTAMQLSDEALKVLLLAEMSENVFYSIQVQGLFEKMHVRVMPKQTAPYPRLAQAAQTQPEFTRENIQGTIVGFFTPALFQGVAAAGFHLHFLSDDRTFGGHILDFTLAEGAYAWMRNDVFTQYLPAQDATFFQTKIDYANLAEEIETAE